MMGSWISSWPTDGEPNYLYHNDGNGRFTDVAYQAGVAVNGNGSEQANMGVALGDFTRQQADSRFAITHFQLRSTRRCFATMEA